MKTDTKEESGGLCGIFNDTDSLLSEKSLVKNGLNKGANIPTMKPAGKLESFHFHALSVFNGFHTFIVGLTDGFFDEFCNADMEGELKVIRDLINKADGINYALSSAIRSLENLYKIRSNQDLLYGRNWKDCYSRYLHSEGWQLIRKKILKRDGHKCCKCGTKEKLHIHHLNYDSVFNERAKDLITLCEDCHKKEHGRKAQHT